MIQAKRIAPPVQLERSSKLSERQSESFQLWPCQVPELDHKPPRRDMLQMRQRISIEPPNGLANLRQVSGAKIAVASFMTDAARRQAQRFVRRHLANSSLRL